MKTKLIFILPLSFLLSNCGWFGNVEEGDKGTFTWKGQLVKDCNEEPMANTEVYLEVQFAGLATEGDVKEVARTTTDENGYFSMTYKRVNKLGATSTYFNYVTGGHTGGLILIGPVNEDVHRNIAKSTCDLIYLDFKNKSGIDSLYFGLNKAINSEYSLVLDFPDSVSKNQQVQAIDVNKTDFEHLFQFQTSTERTWNNKVMNLHYWAADNVQDIRIAAIAGLIDSIPDDFMRHDCKIRGYPLVDTIHLEL